MKPRKTDIKIHPFFTDYVVTKDGRVWSIKRRIWLKQPPGTKGALFVNLSVLGKRHLRRVHRLVLETYIGFRPAGMECRHLDGNPANNKLENLCWGTPKENQADRLVHGTSNRGIRNGLVKLTEQNVRLIFNAYHDGAYTQSYLAKQFKVARTTIQSIVEKRNWKYLWEPVLI